MRDLFDRTFAGLSREYLLRQYFLALLLGGSLMYLIATSNNVHKVSNLIIMSISTLLYPYSRYVYERIANFIVGENQFIVNPLWFFGVKIVTIIGCWALAIFIAPVGLIWLYFLNAKQ